MRLVLLLAAWAAALVPLRADDALVLSTLNPNPRVDHLAIGLHIKRDGIGELVLELPQIVPSDTGTWQWPLHAQLQSDAESVTVPYACGAKFTYALKPDGTVLCSYSGLPPTTQSLWFPMMISVPFANGGRYAFGVSGTPSTPAPLLPFPSVPGVRAIEADRSGPFRLIAPGGAGLLLDTPSDRQGLTDFRPSWSAFSWNFFYTLKDHPVSGSFVLRISAISSPD